MQSSHRLRQSLLYTTFVVSLLWCIKSAEILFHLDLSVLGLRPLQWQGLLGIFTAPLVHGSLEHLFNNTLPLLIMGTVLVYGYPRAWKRVLLFIWLMSGVGVWLFAREANHIGASGVAHGLFFFLLVVSMFRRDKSSVAIMMITFLMYGSMTMTIFPREEHISFEYHFFGAVAGLLAALLWRNTDPLPPVKKYSWENSTETDPVIGDDWLHSEQDSPEQHVSLQQQVLHDKPDSGPTYH